MHVRPVTLLQFEVTVHERLNVTGTPETLRLFSGLLVVLMVAGVLLLSSSNRSCARLVAIVVYNPVWLARITEVAPIANPRTAIATMHIATKTSIRVKPLALLFGLLKQDFLESIKPRSHVRKLRVSSRVRQKPLARSSSHYS